jgi:hypothetical protein
MGYVYGPWQTRSVTVDSLTLGSSSSEYSGYACHAGAMQRTFGTGDRFGGSAFTGWLDPAVRVAAADQARDAAHWFAGQGNNRDEGSGFVTLDPADSDTDSRRQWMRAGAGITTQVSADNTFGLVRHAYDVTLIQGQLSFAILPMWLAGLQARPSPGSTFGQRKPLTDAEWLTLWGEPPSPAYYWRQVDVYACSAAATLHTTYDAHPSTSSPTLTRKRRSNQTTTHVDWFDPDVVHAAATAGTISDGSSWTLTGAFGTGGLQPTIGVTTPINPGDLLFDWQLASVHAPFLLDGTTPGFAGPVEWVVYDSLWPTGTDPGFDATGVDVTTVNRKTTGGDTASHWAQVRLTASVAYSVRFRWYGYVSSAPPPLHQRGRLGVLDAPTQVVSGRMSPQSSGVQGGIL